MINYEGMENLTPDELLDLICELEQDSDYVAQVIINEAIAELTARGEFTGPDYGGQ